MLFAEGRNVKQVQRWLGHAKASSTLDTYLHLLDEGVGEPLEINAGGSQHQPRVGPVEGRQPRK